MKQEVLEKLRKQKSAGKGGAHIMVEDTIRSIRETEEQADEIVREAEQKSREILAKAEKRAEKASEEILSRAKSEALMTAEQAKTGGERSVEDAEAETEKVVRVLKESALLREKEAVDLVISMLV